MPEPTLHPNLAKIAAAYDDIIDRMNRHMLSHTAARSQIAQLEARDDDGTRWSIDPTSGAWVRKTAFGDLEFDATPPTFGYATADAFDLTPNDRAFNPADRLTFQAVSNEAPHPGSLLGATRRLPPAERAQDRPRKAGLSMRTKVIASALAIVAGVVIAVNLTSGDDTDPVAPGDVPASVVEPATP